MKKALLKIAPSPIQKNKENKQKTIVQLFKAKSDSQITKKKETANKEIVEVVLNDESDDEALLQNFDMDQLSIKPPLSEIKNNIQSNTDSVNIQEASLYKFSGTIPRTGSHAPSPNKSNDENEILKMISEDNFLREEFENDSHAIQNEEISSKASSNLAPKLTSEHTCDLEDLENSELLKASEHFDTSNSVGTTSNQAKDLNTLTHGLNEEQMYASKYCDTEGFDYNSGAVWIYPNNMPIRSYQYDIIKQCLHKNTMVVLPTGLGKTFVASVVMLNFYRWYPLGKVVFMAPTKPLVNQQFDACFNIVGISKEDMTQMTGQMSPEKRKILWDSKRVFFLTPQVISNDILRGNLDVNKVKCVIIDEAHRALGEYAFCKVIESINETNKNFRVIALTATPGSDIKTVQGIIEKLQIAHIELRSDDSIDIQQYNHSRKVDVHVIKLDEEMMSIKNTFINVMRNPMKRLDMNRISVGKDPISLSKLFILERREHFRRNPPDGLDQRRCSFIECDLALLVTYIHALELLVQYGVKSFYCFLKAYLDNSDKSKSAQQCAKIRADISSSQEMAAYHELFKKSYDVQGSEVPRNLRHPKLTKLEELIREHFEQYTGTETRVMIFSQYRESVYEIVEILSSHSEIKAMEFVGQSSTGSGGRKSVSQKEQLEVVKRFREGGYNTLVSTCVGEEGLDIGEIDLIICFDSQKSPIRLIQRMGRTGRKRAGRIIVLLAEGKEEQAYKTSLAKKKSIYKVITNGSKNFRFYQNNPLMIPKNMEPKCHKIFIAPQVDSNKTNMEQTKKKRKKTD